MRAAALGVAVLFLSAGCLGTNTPTKTGGPGGTGTTPTVGLNTTEGVLLNSPHLKILGPATVQWNLDNATAEKPEIVSTLMYFGTDVPSDGHEREDGILFAAFIPLNATDALTGCAPTPADMHFFQRNFSGGGDDVGNLTGDYTRGWYHFVAIADEAASISVSFDTESDLRPRKLPGPDPFVTNVQYVSQTGQREYHAALETGGQPWFAWAQHQIGVNGGFGGGGGGGGGGGSALTQVDGGRTHTLGFNGDCAQVSRTSTSPTVSTQDQQHRLRTAAAGTGSGTADAVYSPQQATAAPQSTLHLVAVAVKPVEVPSAPPATPAA